MTWRLLVPLLAIACGDSPAGDDGEAAGTSAPVDASSGDPPATGSVATSNELTSAAETTASSSTSGPPPDETTGGEPPEEVDGIWISVDEIMALPTEGPAWEAVLADAMVDPGMPNLADQEQENNVLVLARAFVCTRLQDEAMCETVREQVMAAVGTEGDRTLPLGRELMAYVICADLVGLSAEDDAIFSAWLADVRHVVLDGRTLVDTHAERPNNWGTHAGASRLAVAVYLDDQEDLQAAADVFHGWLGARDVYAEFEYGELWWQADPDAPVGINPLGATIEGQNVDGVIPDDQRRAGPFEWPPPQENYVYEAMQGALAQAVILERRGFDVWSWEDEALRRVFVWLHDQASFPATGDDGWEPWLVNRHYGTDFPAPLPSSPGKNVGYTDWTHAPR